MQHITGLEFNLKTWLYSRSMYNVCNLCHCSQGKRLGVIAYKKIKINKVNNKMVIYTVSCTCLKTIKWTYMLESIYFPQIEGKNQVIDLLE